jgi:hypothetical protein
MSTQAARNTVRSQLDNVISRAKIKIKEEGKKKVAELKQQIPTPQELAKKLAVEINGDTCSPEGVNKFEKIFQEIKSLLDTIEGICTNALTTLTDIEEKLNSIINKANSGPIGTLNQFVDSLTPIVRILQNVIALSSILYLANSGPTSSGVTQAQIDENKRKAESKIGEYLALFTMIPLMISFYINEAKKILIPLTFLKNKIQFIKDEAVKLRLFIIGLFLQYEAGCDAWNSPNPPPPPPPGPPSPPLSPLQTYLNTMEEQYGEVFNQLQQSGNTLALKRVFTLKEDFEEDYNISFGSINPSQGIDAPGNGFVSYNPENNS